MIARLAFALTRGRHAPGWRARLRTIRRLATAPREVLERETAASVRAHLDWAATLPAFRGRAAPGAPLDAFPVLTRAALQRDADGLRDPTRPEASLLAEASGGSTGEPVRLWHDVASRAWTLATEVYVLSTWGVTPWSRTAALWGDDRGREREGLRTRLERRAMGLERLDVFSTTDDGLRAFARRLERLDPELVLGYATALDLFAAFLAREGLPAPRPRVVRSAAETLSPETRARVAAVFRCPVRDFYGSREAPSIAAECAHGALHVLAHAKVVEILDDAGRAAPPGVPGRVVVTDLANRAFGLVRYENGDVAARAPDDAPCPCGSAYPRLLRILGRTSDFLTSPSGERVHGEWFTHLFYGVAGVRRFQVRQRTVREVEVRTVGEAGPATLDPLLARMRERLGPDVTIRWKAVDDIPTTPSGKHRFTVSDVPFLRGAPDAATDAAERGA